MTQKNYFYYFENYEELCGVSGRNADVYLIRDGEPCGMVFGKKVRKLESYEELGDLEDFPATDYAVKFCPEIEIESDTMLEGLYKAASDMAVHIPVAQGEARTSFTAHEFNRPANKGGADVVWPKGYVPMYNIATRDEGNYTVDSRYVFITVERAEMALGVPQSKRRKFSVCGKEQGELLARFTFNADNTLPKMKNFFDAKSDRTLIASPAIDYSRGVIVATDGRVMAIHKLPGFKAELPDEIGKRVDMVKRLAYGENDIERACISFPAAALSMKGEITVEVYPQDDASGLRIVARDCEGREEVVLQEGRFPNYRSVVPCKRGLVLRLPNDFTKAVKSVGKPIDQYDGPMIGVMLDAPRGYKSLHLSHTCNFDPNLKTECDVQLTEPSGGLFVKLDAKRLLKVLTAGFDRMEFYGCDRGLVLKSEHTVAMVMPLALEDYDRTIGQYDMYFQAPELGTEKYRNMPDGDFQDWLEGTAVTPQPAQPTPKVKRQYVKPAALRKPEPAHQTSASERFRARLRRAMGVAA